MERSVEIKVKGIWDLGTTDRGTCLDIHPTEPWILASFSSGMVHILNFQSPQNEIISHKLSNLSPVMSAKFMPLEDSVVAAVDYVNIGFYDYRLLLKSKFRAHNARIRCVAVHPSCPFLLSSADDSLIKLWKWNKAWINTHTFEDHSHSVLQVTFNPKDPHTFASVSSDGTIKISNIESTPPTFTLRTDKLVTCVDYFTGGDDPDLITGSGDGTAQVWNYKNKSCVHTLEAQGHTHSVSAVCFHPKFPIIITGSEDGIVRIWNSTTYRLEETLNYNLERVWAIGYIKGSRRVVIGSDKGILMLKIGREEPAASMDNSGKVIWAKHGKIQTVAIKSDYEVSDGETLPSAVMELGPCEIYAQSLKHDPNGQFVVCGYGRYIISDLQRKYSLYGSALEIVWSPNGEYAVWESTSIIRIYTKEFQEKNSISPQFSVERIYGGTLLAMCSNDYICFYDWAECRLIQKINIAVKNIYWAESGEQVAIVSDTSFYMLKFKRDRVKNAFEILCKIDERVRTGIWVEEFFIYNNSSWRLNCCVGGNVTTMFHLDRPMYLLGYLTLTNQSHVYLIDRDFNVIGYKLFPSLVRYKTLVMRGDLKKAGQILDSIPEEKLNSVARFLELRGMIEVASEVATDPDYKFELATQLGKLKQGKLKMAKDMKNIVWVIDVEYRCQKKVLVKHGLGFSIKGDISLGGGRELIILTCAEIFEKLGPEFKIKVRRLDEDNSKPATIEYMDRRLNLLALKVEDLSRNDYGVLASDGCIFPGEYLFYIGNQGSHLVGKACFPCTNDEFRVTGCNCDEYLSTTRDKIPEFKVMGDIYDMLYPYSPELMKGKLEALVPVIQISGLLDREGSIGGPLFNSRGEIVGILISGFQKYQIAIHVRAIETFLQLLGAHYFEQIDKLLI